MTSPSPARLALVFGLASLVAAQAAAAEPCSDGHANNYETGDP